MHYAFFRVGGESIHVHQMHFNSSMFRAGKRRNSILEEGGKNQFLRVLSCNCSNPGSLGPIPFSALFPRLHCLSSNYQTIKICEFFSYPLLWSYQIHTGLNPPTRYICFVAFSLGGLEVDRVRDASGLILYRGNACIQYAGSPKQKPGETTVHLQNILGVYAHHFKLTV